MAFKIRSFHVVPRETEVPELSELPPLSKSDKHALTAAAAGALDRVLRMTVSWLPYVAFVFLVCSAANTIYETGGGGRRTVFFVVGCFIVLRDLHLSMREFEKTRDTAQKEKKDRLKLEVWLLSVALTLWFSCRVTTILESAALSVFVWSMNVFMFKRGRGSRELEAPQSLLCKTVSYMPDLSFLFMIYSAIHETKGVPCTIFFAAISFTLLGLFLVNSGEDWDVPSEKKNIHAVISLSVAVTILFSYRVPNTSGFFPLSIFLCFVAVLANYFMFLGKDFNAG